MFLFSRCAKARRGGSDGDRDDPRNSELGSVSLGTERAAKFWFSGVMPTPADSVEEFKVSTANQTADFNSSAGAEVKVVTKRGTNAWHGTAYEYYLDNNFSAHTWDNNFNGLKLA
jgi:hypothetical protein